MAIESVLNTIDGMCNSKRHNVKVYEERGKIRKERLVVGRREMEGRRMGGREKERHILEDNLVY